MNNEQKLLKLLQIAVENGWKDKEKIICFLSPHGATIENIIIKGSDAYNDNLMYSINDLVTNFEEGEVSFIEALVKVTNKEKISLVWFEDDIITSIKVNWILLPTSERL